MRRLLAETMAEVKAGRLAPKVANTVAYVGTVLLRAYEADASSAANTPAQPYVPLIYRKLVAQDGQRHDDDEVIDLYPSKPVGLPAAEAPWSFQLILHEWLPYPGRMHNRTYRSKWRFWSNRPGGG
jgi:hypothetical protein